MMNRPDMWMNMNKKKMWAAVVKLVIGAGVLSVVAGCAGGPRSIQPDTLRSSTNFLTERSLSDMDFPGLQRNLYKHRAACGTAPRFVMEEGETSMATLIETQEIPESYENVVLMDLIQYPETFRAPKRIAVRIYSYYYNDDVQRRADAMLDAVLKPTVCQPAAK